MSIATLQGDTLLCLHHCDKHNEYCNDKMTYFVSSHQQDLLSINQRSCWGRLGGGTHHPGLEFHLLNSRLSFDLYVFELNKKCTVCYAVYLGHAGEEHLQGLFLFTFNFQSTFRQLEMYCSAWPRLG